MQCLWQCLYHYKLLPAGLHTMCTPSTFLDLPCNVLIQCHLFAWVPQSFPAFMVCPSVPLTLVSSSYSISSDWRHFLFCLCFLFVFFVCVFLFVFDACGKVCDHMNISKMKRKVGSVRCGLIAISVGGNHAMTWWCHYCFACKSLLPLTD